MSQYKEIPKVEKERIPSKMQEFLHDWFMEDSEGSYKMLTYLTSKVFNIIRLPTYCDRTINSITIDQVNKYIDELDDMENELETLYRYTQARLKEAGYQENDKIRLYRNICRKECFSESNIRKCSFDYRNDNEIDPIVLATYILYEKLESSQTIELEVNILSSWSQNASSDLAYGHVTIEHEIAVKDILFCNANNDRNGPLESNEWIFINRSNTGLIDFNLEDVYFSESFKNSEIPEKLKRRFNRYDCKLAAENYFRKRECQLRLTPTEFDDIKVPRYTWYEKLINKLTFR